MCQGSSAWRSSRPHQWTPQSARVIEHRMTHSLGHLPARRATGARRRREHNGERACERACSRGANWRLPFTVRSSSDWTSVCGSGVVTLQAGGGSGDAGSMDGTLGARAAATLCGICGICGILCGSSCSGASPSGCPGGARPSGCAVVVMGKEVIGGDGGLAGGDMAVCACACGGRAAARPGMPRWLFSRHRIAISGTSHSGAEGKHMMRTIRSSSSPLSARSPRPPPRT
eukprot:389487-Prymnesium_polylepis.2